MRAQRTKFANDVIGLGGATDPFVLTEIGDIGVARHLSQGSSFSPATDEDRNVWPLHRTRAGEPGPANARDLMTTEIRL